MTVFFQSPTTRLRLWKEFRKSITGLSDREVMERTLSWWESAPLVKCAWDWTRPMSEWPTPWEFLNDGYFCHNSLSLLMAETLLLCGFDRDRLSLKMIRDHEGTHEGIALTVDDRWALGFTRGMVVDLTTTPHTVMEDIPLPDVH